MGCPTLARMTGGVKPSMVVWIRTSAAAVGTGAKARHRRYPARPRTTTASAPKTTARLRERAVRILRFCSVLVTCAIGYLHCQQPPHNTDFVLVESGFVCPLLAHVPGRGIGQRKLFPSGFLDEAGRAELAPQGIGCDEVGIGQLLGHGQAPTRPKDTANLSKRLRAIRDFTEYRNKNDVVKGARCEREVLGAGLNELGALRACGTESATRLYQHFPLNVEADQPPRGTDATGSFQ